MAKSKDKTKKNAPVAAAKPAKKISHHGIDLFMLGRNNYILMIAGMVIILIGFALMAGGATSDKSVFPADEIYSFRRISLAPVVVMLGFLVEIFAIMMKPNSAAGSAQSS